MTSAMAARSRILSRPATFRFLVLEKVSATGKYLLRIVATKEVRHGHNEMRVVLCSASSLRLSLEQGWGRLG